LIVLTMLIGVAGTVLYQSRNSAIDLSSKGWFSNEDLKLLKDPEANKAALPWLSDKDMKILRDPKAAYKEALEKLASEKWQPPPSQQPPIDWSKTKIINPLQAGPASPSQQPPSGWNPSWKK